ncbi:exodeoxyribonuclease VII small subunit [bacterium]|nr:exodeoxyribonuclease VII small subunit [bacterium]
MPKNTEKNISFEKAFSRLEAVVEKLEKGEISLDESVRLFEEGSELIRICSGKLNQAEERLQKLVQDGDRFELIPEDEEPS